MPTVLRFVQRYRPVPFFREAFTEIYEVLELGR
jgi:hypothetical protein